MSGSTKINDPSADKSDDQLLWYLLGNKTPYARYEKACAYRRMMNRRDSPNYQRSHINGQRE